MKTVLLSIVGVLILVGVSLFFYDMSIDNSEKDIRKNFLAQYEVNKTAHDEMWKIIKQHANVTDKYADDFSERVLPELVKGRTGDGEMMKWITESNPEFSDKMYDNLMTSISSERRKFTQSQKRTIDLKNTWTKLTENKPEKWFINSEITECIEKVHYYNEQESGEGGSNTLIEVWKIINYKPVTSSKTEKVFDEGVDDDVELF